MAHRSNVIQVGEKIGKTEDQASTEAKVKDPWCGMEIDPKTSRHMLFRPEATYHFCSKECQTKFMSGAKKPQAA